MSYHPNLGSCAECWEVPLPYGHCTGAFMAFLRLKWSLCSFVVSVLVWSTTRREFSALSPRTGRTYCSASLCLENVLGFLIGAKFAHDGICRKSFPPFPVGQEALSPLARLGTLCQHSLAPGKRDSPEQSPRGARGMPAQPRPAQEDASLWQCESLTLPSQRLTNEFQGLSV